MASFKQRRYRQRRWALRVTLSSWTKTNDLCIARANAGRASTWIAMKVYEQYLGHMQSGVKTRMVGMLWARSLRAVAVEVGKWVGGGYIQVLFATISHRPSIHTPARAARTRTGACAGRAHLGERGEADGVVLERERGVDVLHEAVAEQPGIGAETEVLSRERADALAGAGLGLAEVEAGRGTNVSALAP